MDATIRHARRFSRDTAKIDRRQATPGLSPPELADTAEKAALQLALPPSYAIRIERLSARCAIGRTSPRAAMPIALRHTAADYFTRHATLRFSPPGRAICWQRGAL